MPLPPAFESITAALVGLLVGSFLNVVVQRIPVMMDREDWDDSPDGQRDRPEFARFDLAWPPSHCPHCAHPIRILENIPLVSFALLRGRCACCRRPISWRYPIIEFLGAAIPVLFLVLLGVTPEAAAASLFAWWGLAIAAIDAETYLVPDRLSLPLLWCGLLLSVPAVTVPAESAILGAAVGYGFFFLVSRLGERWAGRPVLGFGDVKLFAAIGAWVGWAALPFVLFAASLAGSVLGLALMAMNRHRRSDPLPFGPFLIFGAVAAIAGVPWGIESFLIPGY